MRTFLSTLFVLSFLFGTVSLSFGTPPKKTKDLKICIDNRTQELVARSRCNGSRTALTLTGISSLVPTSKGEKGDQGIPGPSTLVTVVGDGSNSVVQVPAAISIPSIPGIPPTILPGTFSRSVNCSDGSIVVAGMCLQGGTNDVLSSQGGISAANVAIFNCTWTNLDLTPVSGRLFAKVICSTFP